VIRTAAGKIPSLWTGLAAGTVSVVLKATGIGLVAHLAGDLCRDAGQTAAAGAVELVGTAGIFYVAIPLMQTVLDMITEFL